MSHCNAKAYLIDITKSYVQKVQAYLKNRLEDPSKLITEKNVMSSEEYNY